MHRILGGYMAPDGSVLVAQAGPLLIVSRLARMRLSKQDENIWKMSELQNSPGSISVLGEWSLVA